MIQPQMPVIKTKMVFPKDSNTITGLILPDTHAAPHDDTQGGVDPYAWSCFIQAAQIVKPDFLINLGDFGEWTSVNSYQWKKKGRPRTEDTLDALYREYEAVNGYMDEVDKAVGEDCQKIFIQGNHELWIDNMFAENKHLDKSFKPAAGLRLRQRGYKYYEHGKWVKVGKLYLNHGTQAKGINHNRTMLIRHGKNIAYGHTHDLNAYAMPTLGGIIKAWSCGFLGQRDKEFLRGAPTNWEHGFMIMHLHKSGYFTLEPISIVYGTAWIYGNKVQA